MCSTSNRLKSVTVPRAPGNKWKAQPALQHRVPQQGACPSNKERFEKMSEIIQKLPATQRFHHFCPGPTAQPSLTLTLTLSRLWAKWRETTKRAEKHFPFSGFLVFCWYCQLDQLTEGSGMLHSWAKRISGPGASTAQAEVEQPEQGGNNCLFPETTFSASWNLLSHSQKHYGLDLPDTWQLGNGRPSTAVTVPIFVWNTSAILQLCFGLDKYLKVLEDWHHLASRL